MSKKMLKLRSAGERGVPRKSRRSRYCVNGCSTAAAFAANAAVNAATRIRGLMSARMDFFLRLKMPGTTPLPQAGEAGWVPRDGPGPELVSDPEVHLAPADRAGGNHAARVGKSGQAGIAFG